MMYEGKAKGTAISFNPKNKDVYVSDSTGNITVWGLDKIPKYAWTAHKKSILKMTYLPERNVILTSSKDKTMKLHVLSHDWIP